MNKQYEKNDVPIFITFSAPSEDALIVYVVALGLIDLFIFGLAVITVISGGDSLLDILIAIYTGIGYLLTGNDYVNIHFHSSALFPSLLCLFMITASASLFGAFHEKKWGRVLNIFFLGLIFPFLCVIPSAMIWSIPHIQYLFPIEVICILAVLLLIFNVYYFVWFLRNKRVFE